MAEYQITIRTDEDTYDGLVDREFRASLDWEVTNGHGAAWLLARQVRSQIPDPPAVFAEGDVVHWVGGTLPRTAAMTVLSGPHESVGGPRYLLRSADGYVATWDADALAARSNGSPKGRPMIYHRQHPDLPTVLCDECRTSGVLPPHRIGNGARDDGTCELCNGLGRRSPFSVTLGDEIDAVGSDMNGVVDLGVGVDGGVLVRFGPESLWVPLSALTLIRPAFDTPERLALAEKLEMET